jgi:hypothetical protein
MKKSHGVERIFKRVGQGQRGEEKGSLTLRYRKATHFTEQGNQRKDDERAYTTGRQTIFLSALLKELLAKEYIQRS